jgi:predicted ATP-dependent serine protease
MNKINIEGDGGKARKKRAYTVDNILEKKYKRFNFADAWLDAFGQPQTTGVWFIWGNSGSGKTTFVLHLIKYLAGFDRVLFNSLEEGSEATLQDGLLRTGFSRHSREAKNVLIDIMDKGQLDTYLQQPKSPGIVVVDSFQAFGMNYKEYMTFSRKHCRKLIIFISQADGNQPAGSSASKVRYDATLKIWVEGFRAISKGRFIGPKGFYTIWEDGAAKYN